MQHTSGSFQTQDGLTIHTETWLPEGQEKAMILIVHGYGEHIGRYQHVAEYLTRNGYAACGMDHRGHGQSDGPRVHFDNFDQPINDLKHYFDQFKQQYGRIFIYGHSMGSFIGTQFTLRYQEDLAGLISSGSPLMIDTTVPRIMTTIGNILDRFAPNLPLIKLNLQAISRDPAVVSAYDNDPLVYQSRVRVRLATRYNQALMETRPRLSQLRLPLLVLHGGADSVTPPPGSEYLYQTASSPDKTLKIYPNLYHEIHNEPEKDSVLADIVGWLDQHLT